MTRETAEADGIFLDLSLAWSKSIQMSHKVNAIDRLALEIAGLSLPDMPPGVAGQVRSGLADGGRATRAFATVIHGEIPSLQKRIRALHAALVDEQTSNADRASAWLKRFTKKHNKRLDRAVGGLNVMGMPVGRYVDGSSFVRGFGNGVIGTADMGQLTVRFYGSRMRDQDANRRLANVGNAVAADPGAALRNVVAYDQLTKLASRKTTAQQRREILSELGGGAAFDAALGGLGGGGARLSRAAGSLNSSRRASVRMAEGDVARSQADDLLARGAADKAAKAERKARANADRAMEGMPRESGRGTVRQRRINASFERGRAPGRLADAEAEAARTARIARVEERRLKSDQEALKRAAAQLKQRYVDPAGIRAAAHQVNEVLGVFPGLQGAVQQALEEARRRAAARPRYTTPESARTPRSSP